MRRWLDPARAAACLGIAVLAMSPAMESSAEAASTTSTRITYLALGDSYTIGEGVDADARWPMQLARAMRDGGIALDDPRIMATTGWTTDELAAAIDVTDATVAASASQAGAAARVGAASAASSSPHPEEQTLATEAAPADAAPRSDAHSEKQKLAAEDTPTNTGLHDSANPEEQTLAAEAAPTGGAAPTEKAAPPGAQPRGYGFVSLLIGVNNQYRGRDADDYRGEFEGLLMRAIALADGRADRVLVLSIPDWGATAFGRASGRDRAQIAHELDAYNTIAAETCARHGVAFVDITPVSRAHGGEPAMLVSDGLHPSAAMYAEWTRLALPAARGLLQR